MKQQFSEPMIMTVTGPIPPAVLGIADAHTHTWIEPVLGTRPGLPRLDDQYSLAAELIEFRECWIASPVVAGGMAKLCVNCHASAASGL